MSSNFAPVAFFAFNRPGHTGATLAALAACQGAGQTALNIFVDGPRSDSEKLLVGEVAALARGVVGFGSVSVHVAESNLGLYASITRGVSTVLELSASVIVVEDDILVSTNFLSYMNDGLARFANDRRVGCIHGFSPPMPELPAFYFLPGGDCWGWATWADRWQLFNPDARALLRTLRSSGRLREFAGSHGLESVRQLAQRIRGRNQSWAILWHASLFLAGRLTLHPGKTFVQNIGNDGSGIHSRHTDGYTSEFAGNYSGIPPLDVVADEESARAMSSFMDGRVAGSWVSSVTHAVMRAYCGLLVMLALRSLR